MALQSPEALKLKTVLEDLAQPGELYETLPDGRLHCFACGHHATECRAVHALGGRVAAELGLEHVALEEHNPL